MPRIMSQMSEDELDFLYEQALHNESNHYSVDYSNCNIEDDESSYDFDIPSPEPEPWTDEDEAGLEEFEERRRRKIAERNEY